MLVFAGLSLLGAPVLRLAFEYQVAELQSITASHDEREALSRLVTLVGAVFNAIAVCAVILGASGALLSYRGFKVIDTRIRRAADVATTALTGGVIILEDEHEVIDDSIGRLETDLRSVASALAERDAALQDEAFRQRFDSTIQRAMTMAETETEVYELTRRAMQQASSHRNCELLMADASDAHLRLATSSEPGERPECPAATPADCFAVRRGQSTRFENADALDACPKLQSRTHPADASLCIPIPVMGKAVGVMHTVGDPHKPLCESEVLALESLARHLGARIGMIRALESTKLQAETDALTGLLNRRSLEERFRQMLAPGSTISVVVCDLDHFKRLNDTYGHETGDRALRLFAQVLRRTVRPSDIVARYGGEEFVVVLGDAGPSQAIIALERIRSALDEAIAGGGGVHFTSSFGVAAYPLHGVNLDELIQSADKALYIAKKNGRNRIEVAGNVVNDAQLVIDADSVPEGSSAPNTDVVSSPV